MNKLGNHNFYLLLILLLLGYLLLQVYLYHETELPLCPYERSTISLWARDIVAYGEIREEPCPEAFLGGGPNDSRFNLISPITIAMLNMVTGIDILDIEKTPIYGLAIILLAALSVYILCKKSKIGLIVAVLLFSFVLPPFNATGGTMSRVATFWIAFYLFIYCFIKGTENRTVSIRVLGLISLIFMVLTHSTAAVTLVIFIALWSLMESIRNRDISTLNIGILYSIIAITYYLIIYPFLNLAILELRWAVISGEFNLYLSSHRQVFPTEISYVGESTLIGQHVFIAVLAFIVYLSRLITVIKQRKLVALDSLLLAAAIFIIALPLLASFQRLPTSGLSVLVYFLLLESLVAAYGLQQLFIYTKAKIPRIYPQLSVVVLISLLALGVTGIFVNWNTDYNTAMRTSQQELSACHWLGGKNLTVSSDFNFVASYGAINGPQSVFVPVGTAGVREIYYQMDTELLREEGAQVFVVTEDMKSRMIFHRTGEPTRPNPELDDSLAQDNEVFRIYTNGDSSIYLLTD